MDNTPEQTSRGLGCLRKRIAEEPIALVAFLFSLLVTFVFCWHTIISYDYWWHLHTGNLILDTGTVPKTNLFSFSSPDSQWIDSHWLFQAVLAVAFRFGGHTGSLILQTLIILAAVYFLYATMRPHVHSLVALIGVIWVIFIANPRFLIRPHIITFLFICVFLFVLERFREGGICSGIYWLVPCQWLWVNSHGAFILGHFLIGSYFLLAVYRAWHDWKGKRHSEDLRRRAKQLGGCLFGCVLVCLLNPNWLQGALYPYTLWKELGYSAPRYMQLVSELVPPFSHIGSSPPKFIGRYQLLVVMVIIGFAFNLRKAIPEHIAVAAGFLYLSILARRNTADFAFACLPLAAICLGRSLKLKDISEKHLKIVSCVVFAATLLVVYDVVSNNYYLRNSDLKRFGRAPQPGISQQAIDMLGRIQPKRIFCNPSASGVAMASLSPSPEVFLDGRWEAYNRSVVRKYEALMKGDIQTWNIFATMEKVDTALFMHRVTAFAPLVKELCRSWQLIFLDETCSIFRRTAALDDQSMRPLNSLLLPKENWNEDYGLFLLTIESADANRVLLNVVNRGGGPGAWVNLGHIAAYQGRKDDAYSYFNKALHQDKRTADAHLNLGLLELEENQLEKAKRSFKLALTYSHRSQLTSQIARKHLKDILQR